MVALAVQLRELGAEVRVCAPPDEVFAELLARAGVPLTPVGPRMGSMVRPSTASGTSERVSEFAAMFDTVAEAAEGCDLVLATGFAYFASRSVAEKLGIPYVYVTFCPFLLPSPHHAPPLLMPGETFPPGVTDNRVLWELNAKQFNEMHGEALNAHRASVGLPLVDDVRTFTFTEQPWLATDPILGPWQETSELDVVHTGAWILPDERPLPAELTAFLDAGEPPVYVGFGSMRHVSEDIAGVAIEAIRAQGRRALVGRGWARLGPRSTTRTTASSSARSTSSSCSAEWPLSCTTAAPVRRPPLPWPARRKSSYPKQETSRTGPAGWSTWASGRPTRVPTPTTESLSVALKTALTPETRARATAVAATIRTDGAAVAAKLLLDRSC